MIEQKWRTVLIKKITFIIIIIVSFFIQHPMLRAEQIDMDAVAAAEEFRWGVHAFHEGSFNNAIVSFEKALSYKPGENLIKEWLAWAYFRAGFTDTALEIWERVEKSGEATSALRNWVETVGYRRELGPQLAETTRYVPFHRIHGQTKDYSIFALPSSILPQNDGGFFVSSFGTNDIIKLTSNGTLQYRIRGGIQGFGHPFDITEEQGYLFITEFQADRITRVNKDGSNLLRFGGSGRNDGGLLGPQFITSDGRGYIYVTDQGNRRVAKYDYEGNYLFAIGNRQAGFPGFRKPTGLIYKNGTLYAADGRTGRIYAFDDNGNYLTNYGEEVLTGPEGLSSFDENTIMVVDSNKILLFDLNSEQFMELIDLRPHNVNIISAKKDVNGNILVADFDGNMINLLTDFSRMYTGLTVKVDRVRAESFPEVLVEVNVTTRDGDPYVGLDHNNFFITEDRYPVNGFEFIHAADTEKTTEIALLMERSPETKNLSEAAEQGARQLHQALLGKGGIRVVSAGAKPELITERSTNAENIVQSVVLSGEPSVMWKFDQGVRLAAASLIDTFPRRGVVFFSSGKLDSIAYADYQLTELADFLHNNGIAFYVVYLREIQQPVADLEYLAKETGGFTTYLYDPEGCGPIIKDLRQAALGHYVLKYESNLYADFGREYLPVEVQASHFGRSGRGESGYFSPQE